MNVPGVLSVHIPKTAGTSFYQSLISVLGEEAVLRVYNLRIGRIDVQELIQESEEFDRSVEDGPPTGVRCIHGHYIPLRYKRLQENGWYLMTWLRDPLARLVSNYNHIRRSASTGNYVPGTIGYAVLSENMDFRTYALHPFSRNYYQRFFGPSMPYDFVGIVERNKEDMQYLSKSLFERDLPEYFFNRSTEDQLHTSMDKGLLKAIEEWHQEDFSLYRHYWELSLGRSAS
jgi:hypothetical protein